MRTSIFNLRHCYRRRYPSRRGRARSWVVSAGSVSQSSLPRPTSRISPCRRRRRRRRGYYHQPPPLHPQVASPLFSWVTLRSRLAHPFPGVVGVPQTNRYCCYCRRSPLRRSPRSSQHPLFYLAGCPSRVRFSAARRSAKRRLLEGASGAAVEGTRERGGGVGGAGRVIACVYFVMSRAHQL